MTARAKSTLRSAADLVAAGLVQQRDLAAIDQVAARYAIAITPAVRALIDRTDAADPIARQFVPSAQELEPAPGEHPDPIGDQEHSPVEGLVHRYPDRVLLKLVHSCPVYCRFCFRRETVGPHGAQALSKEVFEQALEYIRARAQIFEVILTGGDPFVLSPRRIAHVTQALGRIAHVAVLRWHTRVPVVDPAAITSELAQSLKAGGKAVYVALHANHPRELTGAALAAIGRLVDAGIPMVTQTVLLKVVNDDPDTLAALMRAFLAARVKPYYLHHGDHAPGTSHFRTTLADGQRIVRELNARLSGLARPAYVLDIPGGYGKVPVGPSYAEQATGGRWRLQDHAGREHGYPPAAEPQKEE